MSAETALQSILAQLGLELDAPNVASTDSDIVQIVAAMNETGQDLAARFEWSSMKGAAVSSNGFAADLPEDFGKLTSSLPVARSDGTPILMARHRDQWALLSRRPSATHYFTVQNGQLFFAPPLPEGSAQIFYQTKYWCEGSDRVQQNGDRFRLPERLIVSGAIWRYRRQKGFPYDDQMAEHEAQVAEEQRLDRWVTA